MINLLTIFPFLFLTVELFGFSFGINNKDSLSYLSDLSDTIKYDVILLGGQSNMLGVGQVSELDDVRLPDNITYLNYARCSKLLKRPEWFGPEVGLSMILNEKFPNRNYLLIKFAIGGSSLYDWALEYDPDKAKITSHPEFGNLFDQFINKLDSLSKKYNINYIGFLWMQGEEDSKLRSTADSYFKNFKSLINSFRDRLNEPELPFIFGIVNPPVSQYPFVEKVKSAQLKGSQKIDDTYMISTNKLPKREDSVHYNSTGQIILGKNFGQCLVKIIE